MPCIIPRASAPKACAARQALDGFTCFGWTRS
nr:MAG TPA: hypothetical protein [Caudoviricetes sp.]DAJ24775.1 MAG TPA: hypothetical protein [Caudoviricetes sp.]DAK97512.1 MAG TPA: hypothetical protein [Caudoviricetes sp.]DAM25739.1 MAG TPA: hypothetical protein [Caudoviricetes sp.]DAT40140.1 MAG TPA: hypothetical protein [Caudoviricetes sp.]